MTDPSQLSTEQLMAIAGPPSRTPSRAAPVRTATPFPGDPEQAITSLLPGVRITSRQRTPQRQRELIAEWERGGRRGVRPADNSRHLTGQAFDLAPGPGQTMGQLEQELRRSGLPFAELINEGDHIHVGWDGQTAGSAEAVQPIAYTPVANDDLETLSDEQLMALADQYGGSDEPSDVVISGGVVKVGDRAVLRGQGQADQDLGSWDEYVASQDRDAADNEARNARQADPNYQAEYAAARGRSENVPALVSNLFQGQTLGALPMLEGALGWLTPNVEGGDRGVASQAARDASRDRLASLMREDPLGTFGAQLAGGLLTPGVQGAGNYIAGAQGAGRGIRAAQVGAGYGVGAGLIGSEGELSERLDDAAISGLVGAGAGAVGQRVIDRLAPAVTERATSAARRLSRAGVNLTPGQMMSEVPAVGSTVKYLEDIAGGFNPLMGSVRDRQNQDVVRAAGNEALGAIGQSLPRNARTGYQVSQNVMRVLGDAYDDVLPNVALKADGELYGQMDDLIQQAGQSLDDGRFGRLQRILDENVFGRFEEDGTLTGEQFKRIETTLRQQSERANRPTSTLEDVDLAEALDGTRSVMRDFIARQNPEQAERIRAINRGYASAARIRRAVTGNANRFAREGTPTPGELAQTVDQMSSENQLMNQSGILQGLATDARTVLPSTVGDTGSGQRALLGSLGVAATGGAAVVNPALAASIAAGAVVYSRPGIAALNAVYRATDSRTAREGVELLARLAQRDPALIPYYEAAVQAVLPEGRNQSSASPQAQQSAPLPMSVQ